MPAKIDSDLGGGEKYILDIATAVKLQTEFGFCNCCSAVALCHTCTSHLTATIHDVKVCLDGDGDGDGWVRVRVRVRVGVRVRVRFRVWVSVPQHDVAIPRRQ